MKWENVYIFISSTFNDMHAERDFLIKRVFPELREWCKARKLKLLDIDLRWGIKEEDAIKNKRVVDICLKNIDKCRPFFLCFLGQRRGWVPGKEDINDTTLVNFPNLEKYIGEKSVTELEIIHAILDPLNEHKKVKHALFYFRNSSYLNKIQDKRIRNIYYSLSEKRETNLPFAGIFKHLGNIQEKQLYEFRKQLKQNYDVYSYHADWNSNKISLELKNIGGEDFSQGRLENFRVDKVTLESHILENLKKAITEEFPEHFEKQDAEDGLGKELEFQDTFLFQATDSYIPRVKEEEKILNYFDSKRNHPYIMVSDAGMGKTSLLAHIIGEIQQREELIYRFAGISLDSSNAKETISSIMTELVQKQYLAEEDWIKYKDNALIFFSLLLDKIKCENQLIIIIDAIDQWNDSEMNWEWLPETLPNKIKLLLSIKQSEKTDMITSANIFQEDYHDLVPLKDNEDKMKLIEVFMSQFFKDIDENQMEHLISLKGSDNPLFLKIILNELRLFGSFEGLAEVFSKGYGQDPCSAFSVVLERLEQEEFSSEVDSFSLVKYFLGILANSLEGMYLPNYAIILMSWVPVFSVYEQRDILDGIYVIVRHLNMYLTVDGEHVDFLYDSFRRAVRERYANDYSEFHQLLVKQYYALCNRNNTGRYEEATQEWMYNLAYHVIETSEKCVNNFLQDPLFLLTMLKKTNAYTSAMFYKMAHEKGFGEGNYAEIGDLLYNVSLKLDVNPYMVFYELNKLAMDNPVITKINMNAQKSISLDLLLPISVGTNKILEFRNIALLETGSYSAHIFSTDKYVLYCNIYHNNPANMIFIQSIETGLLVRRISLAKSVNQYTADDTYLYVIYNKNGSSERGGGIEVFCLSDMTFVKYIEESNFLSQEYHWQNDSSHGFDRAVYDIAYTRNEEYEERIIYQLDTGKIIFRNQSLLDQEQGYSTDGQIEFCEKYFVCEKNRFSGTLILGTLDKKIIKEIELRVGNLCWKWIIKNNVILFFKKDIDDVICYKYINTNNEFVYIGEKTLLELKGTWDDLSGVMLNDNYIIVIDAMGRFFVYDIEFQFVGCIQTEIYLGMSLSNMFIGCKYGKDIKILSGNMLHILSCKKFHSALSKKNIDEGTVRFSQGEFFCEEYKSALIRQDKITAFIDGKMGINIDINNENIYNSKIFNSRIFELNTEIIYENRAGKYILGISCDDNIRKYNIVAIYIHSLECIKVGIMDMGMRFDGSFLAEGVIGIIARRPGEQRKQIYKKEERIVETWKIYVLYLDTKGNIVDKWDVQIHQSTGSIRLVRIGKSLFFICSGIYIDEKQEEIRIYSVKSRECVFKYKRPIGASDLFYNSDMAVINNRIFLLLGFENSWEKFFLDIDICSGNVLEIKTSAYNMVGYNEAELFLASRSCLEIYSTENCHINEISLDRENLQQRKGQLIKVIHKYKMYMCFYEGGYIEGYSIETKERIYQQMLGFLVIVVEDCPNQDCIYIQSTTGGHYLLKKKKLSELEINNLKQTQENVSADKLISIFNDAVQKKYTNMSTSIPQLYSLNSLKEEQVRNILEYCARELSKEDIIVFCGTKLFNNNGKRGYVFTDKGIYADDSINKDVNGKIDLPILYADIKKCEYEEQHSNHVKCILTDGRYLYLYTDIYSQFFCEVINQITNVFSV